MSWDCKRRTSVWPMAVALAALLAGSSVAVDAEIVPDFEIPDVNPTSLTFGDEVSPRDYLQQVSGWYFGHAT